jgi:hypothetical protein
MSVYREKKMWQLARQAHVRVRVFGADAVSVLICSIPFRSIGSARAAAALSPLEERRRQGGMQGPMPQPLHLPARVLAVRALGGGNAGSHARSAPRTEGVLRSWPRAPTAGGPCAAPAFALLPARRPATSANATQPPLFSPVTSSETYAPSSDPLARSTPPARRGRTHDTGRARATSSVRAHATGPRGR